MTDRDDNDISPNPFVSPDAPMFADVIEMLDTVDGLSPSRRRDLRSGLKTMARLISRDPAEIPANINWVHIRIRRIHPAAHRISKKRWSGLCRGC